MRKTATSLAATSAFLAVLGHNVLASGVTEQAVLREFVRMPVQVDGSKYEVVIREGDNLVAVLREFCSNEHFPFSDAVAQCEGPLKAEAERLWQARMVNDVALTVSIRSPATLQCSCPPFALY